MEFYGGQNCWAAAEILKWRYSLSWTYSISSLLLISVEMKLVFRELSKWSLGKMRIRLLILLGTKTQLFNSMNALLSCIRLFRLHSSVDFVNWTIWTLQRTRCHQLSAYQYYWSFICFIWFTNTLVRKMNVLLLLEVSSEKHGRGGESVLPRVSFHLTYQMNDEQYLFMIRADSYVVNKNIKSSLSHGLKFYNPATGM